MTPIHVPPPSLGALGNLLAINPSQVQSALAQVGTAIDNLRGSSLFDFSLGITHALDVGDVLKLKEAWDAGLTSLFSGDDAVSDINALLDRLDTGGSYNTDTGILTFDVDLSRALAEQSGNVGFDAGLGPLADISTASLADIQASAKLKFTVGINLHDPIGSLFTLTDDTPLTSLNPTYHYVGDTYEIDESVPSRWSEAADRSGQDDSVHVTLSDGTSFDVRLDTSVLDDWDGNVDGSAQIGAVLDTLNTAAAAALGPRYGQLYVNSAFATIDGQQKSLRLTDKTRGEEGSFSITAVDGSPIGLAGVGLGIYGTSSSPNSAGDLEIVGAPLHGDSLAQRIYLVSQADNRPTLGGTIDVTASDINAEARVLTAEASIAHGSATAHATLTLTLDGSAADDGRITLDELIAAARTPDILDASPNFTGSLSATLPASVTVPWSVHLDGEGQPVYDPIAGDITVNWSDLTDASSLNVDYDTSLNQVFELGTVAIGATRSKA